MRLRKLIPTEAKLRIYKTAILPHLTYCNLVWHFCKATDKKKLERVNERGLRAVFYGIYLNGFPISNRLLLETTLKLRTSIPKVYLSLT